jgi:hypothetical protein
MEEDDRHALSRDESRVLAPEDLLEFYPGVQVGRARHVSADGVVDPASVMAEAPTMTLRVVSR